MVFSPLAMEVSLKDFGQMGKLKKVRKFLPMEIGIKVSLKTASHQAKVN